MASAENSLDLRRLERVAAAAQLLLPRFQEDAEEVRIDVIYIVPKRLPKHLENVWQG